MKNLSDWLRLPVPLVVIAAFVLVILGHLVANWSRANYRDKDDYLEAVEYFNNKALPATSLYSSQMEYSAWDAYSALAFLRRDFIFQRHNYELTDASFQPGTFRIYLPALLYHKDIDSKDPLYYMKDMDSIRRAFFVAALEENPGTRFRHVTADIGNDATYQGSIERNLYYLLPKSIESQLNQTNLNINEANIEQHLSYFVSNLLYSKEHNRLEISELSFPANIFLPVQPEASSKVSLDVTFGSKPATQGCKFDTAQALFFYNNHFIAQKELKFGALRADLMLQKEYNYKKVNVLSIILAFNQSNKHSNELTVPNFCQLVINGLSYATVPNLAGKDQGTQPKAGARGPL